MKIKICGLTRPEEADFLNENRADYAGFVLFYEKSKRNMTIGDTLPIRQRLDPAIKTVAVTVSPTPEMIRQICGAGFDYIQIHGTFPADPAGSGCTIPIFRAVNMKDASSLQEAAGAMGVAGLLFDAPKPGSGRTFDWNMLKGFERRKDMLYILK